MKLVLVIEQRRPQIIHPLARIVNDQDVISIASSH